MLKLYNTATRQKEEFQSIQPGKVGMYVCGPTVYDHAHIGNLKSFITADILRRYLEHSGYEVRMIKNITDVGHLTDDDLAQGDSGEDKMEKAAKREDKTPEEIAKFYEEYFKQAEKEMNILPAQFFPRATAHVPHMIAIVEKLIENGHAYESNGNVFFDVASFKDYGKLSGNTLENLQVGARLEEAHPDKKNQWDFALWLKAPKEHIMKWNSPWSTGYPGWHIECSAMSIEYLGENFDIHTGGEDHIFPHHEAEIAQTEGATGKKWVNFWTHTRHMMNDGEKMSKSKGNFYKLEDVKEKGFSAVDLRILMLLSHYRSQMNFTWESLKQAQKNRKTLENFLIRLHKFEPVDTPSSKKVDVEKYRADFESAMNDDLNTPLAISVVLSLITETNTLMDNDVLYNTDEIKIFITKALENVLGIIVETTEEDVPDEIKILAKRRQKAREEKDYSLSDKIRDEITTQGYEVKDVDEGYEIKKL